MISTIMLKYVMPQKIVFFGSGWFVVPVIKTLINHGLAFVVTNESEGEVVEFCKANNIEFVSSNLKDTTVIEKIKSLNPTVAILASYGAFVPDSVISAFPKGIINIHPSLLPKYKGPSPVQYALLNNETITGVTLIRLDDQIDHGPILAQRPYNLNGTETSKDLLSILFEIGAQLVEEVISKLEKGEEVQEKAQDHSQETWSYKIEKKDGLIDPTNLQDTRFKLDCMIRGLYPWPGVWFRTLLKGQEKIVKLLPEGKIQVEGKNSVTYKDFLNGFGDEGHDLLSSLSLI